MPIPRTGTRSLARGALAGLRRGSRPEWTATEGHVRSTVQPVLNRESREVAAARLGRALADSTRRRLLLALVDGPGYPAVLAQRLELTRSNVSNHLSCLRGCGLVVAHDEGRQVRYELADHHLGRALSELLEVVLAVAPSPECEPQCTPAVGRHEAALLGVTGTAS